MFFYSIQVESGIYERQGYLLLKGNNPLNLWKVWAKIISVVVYKFRLLGTMGSYSGRLHVPLLP